MTELKTLICHPWLRSDQIRQCNSQRVGPLVPKRYGILYLCAEFSFLFIGIPLLLYFFRRTFGAYVIPTILLLAGFCMAVLLYDRRFDRKMLSNIDHFYPRLRKTLLIFIPWSAALVLAWGIYSPQQLFSLPGHSIRVWVVVMVAYPLLSVYPQEIIFRTFLFHRYRPLFPSKSIRIWVSGLTFALAHLFFANWIAPTLTVLGGIIFARTYAHTFSTLQASLAHALWGNLIFTTGMGWYFYGGAVS